MRNFQDAYKDAMNTVPRRRLSAEQLLAESPAGSSRQPEQLLAESPAGSSRQPEQLLADTPHGKQSTAGAATGRRPVGSMWVKGVAAAAILVICSAGTATAVNYQRSRIRVEEQGYSVTGHAEEQGYSVTGHAEEQGYSVTGHAEEQAYSVTGSAAGGNGNSDAGEGEGGIALCGAESGLSAEDAADKLSQENYCIEESSEEEREYDSVEAFRSAERITMAIPETDWLGETEMKTQIYVSGDGTMVTVMLFGSGERSLFMTQWDTRDYEAFASSTSFMGDSENERNFTSAQGLSYVVFDTVEGEEILSTHAVISVEGRELGLDFQGYEESVIERVLRELDLSVYFAD